MKRLIEYTKKQPEKVQNKIMLISAGGMTVVIALVALLLQRQFTEPRNFSFDQAAISDFKQRSDQIFDDLNSSFQDVGAIVTEAKKTQSSLEESPPVERTVLLKEGYEFNVIQGSAPSLRLIKQLSEDTYRILINQSVDLSSMGFVVMDDDNLKEADTSSAINN